MWGVGGAHAGGCVRGDVGVCIACVCRTHHSDSPCRRTTSVKTIFFWIKNAGAACYGSLSGGCSRTVGSEAGECVYAKCGYKEVFVH